MPRREPDVRRREKCARSIGNVTRRYKPLGTSRGYEHQKLVGRMVTRAEGGAGFLHRITKPAARRGGLHVLEELENMLCP